MVKTYLEQVRNEMPHIHCISNLVSANFCANGLLACGGRPIMAEAKEEVEEITAQCQGLNLNLGIPSLEKMESMILAGKVANEKRIPVVFDPVGVGASQFRMEVARNLISQVSLTVIRGNVAEIQSLGTGIGSHSGVDIPAQNQGIEMGLDEKVRLAIGCAKNLNTIVLMSGEVDIVTDGSRTYLIKNGHSMMSKVTATGCLSAVLTTAFLAVSPDDFLMATVASCCMMGVCGMLAREKQEKENQDGTGSYGMYLLDAISTIRGEVLECEANYELYK